MSNMKIYLLNVPTAASNHYLKKMFEWWLFLKLKHFSSSAHISVTLVSTLPLDNHQTSIREAMYELHPFLHTVWKKSALQSMTLNKINTIFIASFSRHCRLVGIFFTTTLCWYKKQSIHTAVSMWVFNFTFKPFFFPVTALHHHYIFLCIFPSCMHCQSAGTISQVTEPHWVEHRIVS
jgi:hypothetical protein